MSANKSGIVRLASKYSFSDTFERLESFVESRGLTIFARIDFSGDAAGVGLKMSPTRLLIFGNPRAGTPLMIAAPSVAIDFPLKILVSEDDNGKAWVSFTSVDYLKDRHGLPDSLVKNISGIASIAESVIE